MTTYATAQKIGGTEPPKVKGGLPWIGHMLQFSGNPYNFLKKAAAESGEIASFVMLGQKIVLLTGDEASELFFRSSDEYLDQSAAYKLMTPIFGEGLVFDAPIERKNEQLQMLMPSLRMEAMREHSYKIVQEVEGMLNDWDDSGEVELVAFTTELTINTASHCLLGKEFRYELSEEFAGIYADLEGGISPVAYHFPYLPIPKFKRRDKARVRLQELIGEIIKKREAQKEKSNDMFQTLIDMSYKDGTKLGPNEITGLLVGAVFAGHHTSSGTAAWLLIELLRNPQLMVAVKKELDDLLGAKGDVTFQSLREMPVLENVLKEVLRLHPPLIILMRKVTQDLHFKNYTIKAGDMVWASPPVTHRMSNLFTNPEAFDPDRFSPERAEDKNMMAYQPFGGGKHKCSGNAFAMFQIKAIFAILLRRYEFELVDSPESYVDDYTALIVAPKSPCKVRYRHRDPATFETEFGTSKEVDTETCPFSGEENNEEGVAQKSIKVEVDNQLCQGHAVCMGEAPEYFNVGDDSVLTILKENISASDRKQVELAVKYCPNQALKLVED